MGTDDVGRWRLEGTMSGRCPGVEIKVRWTLACTEATGVLASRSHYWHLHLVATSGQSLSGSPAPRPHLDISFAATAERREHTYANVHSSRLITEKTAARP